jgi:hypothetical protein
MHSSAATPNIEKAETATALRNTKAKYVIEKTVAIARLSASWQCQWFRRFNS